MSVQIVNTTLAGLMAEFAEPEELIEATRKVREAGYAKFDAFSPYPIEELNEAMGTHDSKLPPLVFLGGLAGALTGWGLQYWSSTIAYPMNIGGRPYNSWPAFIVVIFELTILFAAFTAVLGMFALNGLPRPHHPVFSVERFELCSRDRYFLYIEADDPGFDLEGTRGFLEKLGPSEVMQVEAD